MPKILIVDEDTDVLRLLQVKLGRAGYTVSRARDAGEAQQLMASEPPDLLLMELLLPDIEGHELLRLLPTLTPSAPLIMILSGKTGDADIAAAFAAGAIDYMTKPFSPQGLLERVRMAFIRANTALALSETQINYE